MAARRDEDMVRLSANTKIFLALLPVIVVVTWLVSGDLVWGLQIAQGTIQFALLCLVGFAVAAEIPLWVPFVDLVSLKRREHPAEVAVRWGRILFAAFLILAGFALWAVSEATANRQLGLAGRLRLLGVVLASAAPATLAVSVVVNRRWPPSVRRPPQPPARMHLEPGVWTAPPSRSSARLKIPRPMFWSLFCRVCNQPATVVEYYPPAQEHRYDGAAGRSRLPSEWLGHEIVTKGFFGRRRDRVDELVGAAVEMRLLRVVWEGVPQAVPFFCPECNSCYCADHWRLAPDLDLDDPLARWYGYCPQGHERIVDERDE